MKNPQSSFQLSSACSLGALTQSRLRFWRKSRSCSWHTLELDRVIMRGTEWWLLKWPAMTLSCKTNQTATLLKRLSLLLNKSFRLKTTLRAWAIKSDLSSVTTMVSLGSTQTYWGREITWWTLLMVKSVKKIPIKFKKLQKTKETTWPPQDTAPHSSQLLHQSLTSL